MLHTFIAALMYMVKAHVGACHYIATLLMLTVVILADKCKAMASAYFLLDWI